MLLSCLAEYEQTCKGTATKERWEVHSLAILVPLLYLAMWCRGLLVLSLASVWHHHLFQAAWFHLHVVQCYCGASKKQAHYHQAKRSDAMPGLADPCLCQQWLAVENLALFCLPSLIMPWAVKLLGFFLDAIMAKLQLYIAVCKHYWKWFLYMEAMKSFVYGSNEKYN